MALTLTETTELLGRLSLYEVIDMVDLDDVGELLEVLDDHIVDNLEQINENLQEAGLI